jgi:hypothetical protein
LKQIDKITPRSDRPAQELTDFLDVTCLQIEKEHPSQFENINAYLNLAEQELYCEPKVVQEYYTEALPHNDPIAHLAVIVRCLQKNNNRLKAIGIYLSMLEKINYYLIVLVEGYAVYSLISNFARDAKNISSESEAEEYQSVFCGLCAQHMMQGQLFLSADLSYCRLYQPNKEIMKPVLNLPIDYLSAYYTSLKENKFLDPGIKNRLWVSLYDSLRMVGHDRAFISPTVEEFRKSGFGRLMDLREFNLPAFIYAKPVALMILRMIEVGDRENISLFMSMNAPSNLMLTTQLLVLLSVFDSLVRHGKKRYQLDLDIGPSKTLLMLREVNIWNHSLFDECEMLTLYDRIVASKNENENHSAGREYSVYGFYPAFSFEKTAVDALFLKIFEIRGLRENFLRHIGQDEITIGEDINNLLEEIL